MSKWATGLAALLLLIGAPVGAQKADPRAMIRLAASGAEPVAATIGNLAWLEGSWVGDMEGAEVEHVIFDAGFGQMPSFVRSMGAEGIAFYEIAVFTEVGSSVSYRVKHFTSALAGWEGQDAFVDRPLIARDEATLFFDGITFERTGPDSFVVYFLDRSSDGQERSTLVIPFQRQAR